MVSYYPSKTINVLHLYMHFLNRKEIVIVQIGENDGVTADPINDLCKFGHSTIVCLFK